MREFYVTYGNVALIYTEEEFKNFLGTAIFHNKDIHKFEVIEIDRRLSVLDAIKIANSMDFVNEVIDRLEKGDTPYEAIQEWLK